jgi:hypothetical protein
MAGKKNSGHVFLPQGRNRMSARIDSSSGHSGMEISQEEVAESQEQPGAPGQTEHAGQSSRRLESWAQAYPEYERYAAAAGHSDEAQSGMERPEIESVHQSPSPDLKAGPENQTPELSEAARADLALQTGNYQGEPMPLKAPLDAEKTPLYSGTQKHFTEKYARLGPLAPAVASARALIDGGSLTRVGAEKGIYKKLYKTSPPPTENELNHKLRQTVGKVPHKKILEQLSNGAQPGATSSVHQQNAFHKLAESSGPRQRTTDALIKHTPSDQLSGAAIARDRDGKTPIGIARERLEALSGSNKKDDEVKRVRLTHLINALTQAAPIAEPVQGSNEPHKDEERRGR